VHPSITGDYSYKEIERGDFELSRLVVESLLSEEIRDNMRVRYDHDINFCDYPGGVLVMMALEISNASVSYDIKGAQVKLDELTLSNYPGEDVSAFCSDAQRQIKVMQSGYALPILVGSKLLMKCTKTECEYFNRKVFDRLDKVKDMEDKSKLADPASITNDPGYHEYGPIGVIAWAQKIHSKFLADHEWPGLASKLSHLESTQSNYVQTKGKFTCYHCGEDGHIKPNCPKLQAGVPKAMTSKRNGARYQHGKL
jgi:DNA-directed RNA polymerase subunit M/transcription elongation factor TFIIS